MNNKIIWIDISKFIGIFLVIFVYTLTGLTKFSEVIPREYIHLFFMQLFFIISGYLYKNKTSNENIKKIFYGLFIPYIIYSLISFPFVIGQHVLIHHEPFLTTTIKSFLGILVVGSGMESETFFYKVCPPLWFIVTLIEVRLLFVFIKASIKNAIIISILSIILTKILFLNNAQLLFCLGNAVLALPYFCFGYIVNQIFPNFKNQYQYTAANIIKLLFSTLIIGILLFIILKINGYSVMGEAIYSLKNVQHISLVFIGALLGSFMVINFAKIYNSENSFVKVISENTLFIIFFHWLVIFIMKWIKIPILFKTDVSPNYKLIFLFALLNLGICYFAIKSLKKFPLILGKYNYKTKED